MSSYQKYVSVSFFSFDPAHLAYSGLIGLTDQL
jgi:hypothetical protein